MSNIRAFKIVVQVTPLGDDFVPVPGFKSHYSSSMVTRMAVESSVVDVGDMIGKLHQAAWRDRLHGVIENGRSKAEVCRDQRPEE